MLVGISSSGDSVQWGLRPEGIPGGNLNRSLVGIPFVGARIPSPYCPEYPLIHEILVGIPEIGVSEPWGFRTMWIPDTYRMFGKILTKFILLFVLSTHFYTFENIFHDHNTHPLY